jgi:hypothetical protein
VPLIPAYNEKERYCALFFASNILNMKSKINILRGVRAGLVHLLCSLLVAAVLAALVFGLWYPHPYRELVGGTELFLLVIAVDVVCGPLLTAVIFNPAKPRKELIMDLGLVVMIQLAALVYGMYTVVQARPIYSVFEVDRFRVVTAADIDSEDWAKAKAPWSKPPWGAPQLITVRVAASNEEKLESIDLAMGGKDLSARPNFWKAWDAQTPELVLKRAKNLADVRKKLAPPQQALLDAAVARSGLSPDRLRSLPMTSFKNTDWVALIDSQTAKPVAYAPVDGF